MANYVHDKYTTSIQAAYGHPQFCSAYQFYTPGDAQDLGITYEHGKGTAKWFQDYRRSQKAEKCLQENLESAGINIRPTWLSDKSDRVLGARHLRREELLNRPDYKMFNTLPERERGLREFEKDKERHRKSYKDLSGTVHKVDTFHYPTEASQQFQDRDSSGISSYPSTHRSALEHTWEAQRGPKHYALYRGTSDFIYHKNVPEI